MTVYLITSREAFTKEVMSWEREHVKTKPPPKISKLRILWITSYRVQIQAQELYHAPLKKVSIHLWPL